MAQYKLLAALKDREEDTADLHEDEVRRCVRRRDKVGRINEETRRGEKGLIKEGEG